MEELATLNNYLTQMIKWLFQQKLSNTCCKVAKLMLLSALSLSATQLMYRVLLWLVVVKIINVFQVVPKSEVVDLLISNRMIKTYNSTNFSSIKSKIFWYRPYTCSILWLWKLSTVMHHTCNLKFEYMLLKCLLLYLEIT